LIKYLSANALDNIYNKYLEVVCLINRENEDEYIARMEFEKKKMEMDKQRNWQKRRRATRPPMKCPKEWNYRDRL
jgi:hypothetical protein